MRRSMGKKEGSRLKNCALCWDGSAALWGMCLQGAGGGPRLVVQGGANPAPLSVPDTNSHKSLLPEVLLTPTAHP